MSMIKAQKNPCKHKGQLPDESNTVATCRPITLEENEAPNTTEDSIYENTDWLKVPENIHHATIAGPSNTNLPNVRANDEERESESSEEEDSCEAIYSNVH
ncbi:20S proteasome subunit alpha 2 [Sarotherodon galilaeus]